MPFVNGKMDPYSKVNYTKLKQPKILIKNQPYFLVCQISNKGLVVLKTLPKTLMMKQ